MDFERSDEQDEIAALARRILTDQVTEDLLRKVEANGAERFDPDVWQALADAGLLGVAVPTELGGLGFGIIEQCLVLVEVGRTIAPVPVLASIVGGALPIAEFRSVSQHERWVTPAVEGRVVLTAALAEPSNRWPERPTTTAVDTADGWVLDGVKTCVPAGTVADAFLVPASVGAGRVVVCIVERDAVGLRVDAQQVTNRDTEALLTLEGVTVDPSAVLGSPDRGHEVLAWMVERSTVALCAQVSGIVACALEVTAAYTKERIQFDRPIATFQAVGQRRRRLHRRAGRRAGVVAGGVEAVGGPAGLDRRGGGQVLGRRVGPPGGSHRRPPPRGDRRRRRPPHPPLLLAAKELEFTLGGATDQLLRIGAAMAASRD